MSNLKKILMTAMTCLATASFASAQDGEALPFTRIVRDPVSAGMGFAGVAWNRDSIFIVPELIGHTFRGG